MGREPDPEEFEREIDRSKGYSKMQNGKKKIISQTPTPTASNIHLQQEGSGKKIAYLWTLRREDVK